MADEPQWEDLVRECVYRPFDRRYVCWADWMIDWPRNDVMRHMLEGGNVALVTRRQMLPTQPCNFFWVADTIVIDGLIRSDNRGSESFFPLYLRGGERGEHVWKRVLAAELRPAISRPAGACPRRSAGKRTK